LRGRVVGAERADRPEAAFCQKRKPDSQQVEIFGRAALTAELVADGLEVATPERDTGIDLLTYTLEPWGVVPLHALSLNLFRRDGARSLLRALAADLDQDILDAVEGNDLPALEVHLVTVDDFEDPRDIGFVIQHHQDLGSGRERSEASSHFIPHENSDVRTHFPLDP
jgi:hypothetical protein